MQSPDQEVELCPLGSVRFAVDACSSLLPGSDWHQITRCLSLFVEHHRSPHQSNRRKLPEALSATISRPKLALWRASAKTY